MLLGFGLIIIMGRLVIVDLTITAVCIEREETRRIVRSYRVRDFANGG